LITDPQGFPFTVGTNQGGYEPIGAEYKEEKLQLSAGVFDPSKSFEEVLAPLTERIVRAFGTDHCPFVKDGRLTRDTVESLWV
jgi:hypothetical protein